MVRKVFSGDDYSNLYTLWAEQYRLAVEEAAEAVLTSVDTDLDDDLDPDSSVLFERLQEETNDRSEGYWFEPAMSREHAAFICLVNSNNPSDEPFNHEIKVSLPTAEFPFADCAAAAFEADVNHQVCELVGYHAATITWDIFDWKREIENYCAAAKAAGSEGADG